jgi:hypothetical protein
MKLKAQAEADGITEKAKAMKLFDSVGREHEEFKLRLNKEKDIELAQIRTQADIAASQAGVLGEALRHAKIDIVGGEAQFFDRITNAIAGGKSLDRLIDNSKALTDVKDTFFSGDPEQFHTQLRGYIDRFGLNSEDLKNLTISAALTQMLTLADDAPTKGLLSNLLGAAKRMGLGDQQLDGIIPAKNGRHAKA